MKKIIIVMVVAALLLVGCQPTNVKTPPVETDKVEVQTDTPSEPVQTENEPTVTPIPDNEKIAVDNEFAFTPVLYCSGGQNLVLGGSHHGQWLTPDRFEGKLDGELVPDRGATGAPTENVIEFALIRAGQAINFYNDDGCVGDGTVESVKYIIDGMGNEYYDAAINVISGVDTPTIGIPETTWNPYPFPFQCGGNDGTTYNMDMDNDGTMEKLVIAEEDMGEYKLYTVTIEMYGKTIPVAEMAVDGTYLTGYQIDFLDLNGDGRLDIVISQEGHNLGVSVYDITEDGAVDVLHQTIGD